MRKPALCKNKSTDQMRYATLMSPFVFRCIDSIISLVLVTKQAEHEDRLPQNEPCYEKTGFLLMRKQRRGSASR